MMAVLLKDTLLNLLDKAVRCVQQSTYTVGQGGLLAVLPSSQEGRSYAVRAVEMH